MQKNATSVLLAALLAATVSAAAHAQATVVAARGDGKAAAAAAVEVTATIAAIDAKTRTVTLRGDDGKTVDVVAGADVKRFDELRVGDHVHFEYYESITLSLEKVAGGEPTRTESASETRAAAGAMPAHTDARQVTLTAKVSAVDTKASTVTLVGPGGRAETLEVDAEALGKVKVGDMVKAVYTEALAISVTRDAKP